MINEIEIGEYIRTNKGLIGKIKRIDFDEIDKSLKWYVFNHKEPNINIVKEVYINKPYIVKHSKDITDLLEDTDILKVKITEEWVKKEDTIAFIVVEQLESIKEIKEALENGMYTIEQVLTKEQFQKNSYKVGV